MCKYERDGEKINLQMVYKGGTGGYYNHYDRGCMKLILQIGHSAERLSTAMEFKVIKKGRRSEVWIIRENVTKDSKWGQYLTDWITNDHGSSDLVGCSIDNISNKGAFL